MRARALGCIGAMMIAAAGCGSRRSDAAAAGTIASAVDAGPVADPAVDTRRWIAGDLHVHVAPIDTVEGQQLTIEELAAMGPKAGLEWAIATPHLHPDGWASAARHRTWIARWKQMVDDARAARGMTVIVGTEWTVRGFGHFGVSGLDMTQAGADVLGDAARQGGFVVVNHPFAIPTHIPGVHISEHDLSFRPWTDGRGRMPHLDGVEVWNVPLGLGNLVSRPGGMSGEERAFAAADELARRERRPIAITGGSDTHRPALTATTWVLAPDAGAASVMAALHHGATCVGGPEAGTLAAHGDRDPAGAWARIGDEVRADATVELRWTGTALLFVDGQERGSFDGGWTDTAAAGVHTYRIEQGTSRCGFVYANLK